VTGMQVSAETKTSLMRRPSPVYYPVPTILNTCSQVASMGAIDAHTYSRSKAKMYNLINAAG